MIHPYAGNSGALFGRSVKSGIAEIMTAIKDACWVIFMDSMSSLWKFWSIPAPKGDLPNEERGNTWKE
jgi:hypothetical protein